MYRLDVNYQIFQVCYYIFLSSTVEATKKQQKP
jgi:hypothetical protein